ncbi:uncharacterized protein LOC143149824 isoform X1 [Ptiloglossa arizonensis]|uniref:uncharacterized protein LOC143149824 isoform X1 n=1 Tax=Ptiloglossa arizonensis TaxID=3350558 RepID=UPI003FA11F3B
MRRSRWSWVSLVAAVSQSPSVSGTVSLVDRSLVRSISRSVVGTIADSLACSVARSFDRSALSLPVGVNSLIGNRRGCASRPPCPVSTYPIQKETKVEEEYAKGATTGEENRV